MVLKCGEFILVPNQPQRVPLSFVAMWGHGPLQYDFSEADEALAARTPDGRLKIDFRCPLSGVDGYGRHAVWLIRAFQRAGVDTAVRDVGWVDNDYLAPDINEMRYRANRQLPSKIGVSFTLGYDPNLYQHSSPVKIGITQFETDTLPRKHVENVNKLDHCIVTSRFQVKVFQRSGVTVPITVMSPGIEASEFPYGNRRMNREFRVLIIGALTPRKNPLGAIRIFREASQGNPDWRLTIKTRPAAAGLAEVRRLAAGDSRITVLAKDDDPYTLVQHYYEHHCLLWPSLGEGVGLPPLEAMATGMELVCSANSGMLDYVDPAYCYPIKMAGMQSAHGPGVFSDEYVEQFGSVGQWWTPDEAHAAKQLSRCFDNWVRGKGKGRHASGVVHECFAVDQSVASILPVLERFA